MIFYEAKPLSRTDICVSVPASKSILNRALLLAAFTGGDTFLSGAGEFGQDTCDLLGALSSLGIATERRGDGLLVHGRTDFRRKAVLDVGSAGTAARFLTAILAFLGGEYEMTASEQMRRRPMELLGVLEKAGADFYYYGQEEHFPFRMESKGIEKERLCVDTDVSTQYASGILLAAALGKTPFTLALRGSRTQGSYIQTTLAAIEAFGGKTVRRGDEIAVFPIQTTTAEYSVAPDISGACYFYALSLLCGANVRVRGVHFGCGQADEKFLGVLQEKGVKVTDAPEGLTADGTDVKSFTGFDLDMRDFADQTLTLAAMAPFATSQTVLRNIAHIRRQECDRVEAILRNLTALGVPCTCRGEEILIEPSPVRPAEIETFGDHRVAMAFALVGLKAGGVKIKDPDCCKKTFENYFDILDGLTQE